MIRRNRAVVFLAAMALLLPLSLAATEEQFSRTLTVTGPVELDVDTGSGNITVRTGSSNTVSIVGHMKPNRGNWFSGRRDAEEMMRRLKAAPPIEQHGNSIRVGHIADRDIRRALSISYELTVPRDTRLEAGTGSGDQSIEGIAGPAHVSSGSGTITLTKIGSAAEVSTGSGDVVLTSIAGSVHANTGSGSIRGTAVGGAISASTGSGDVRLEQSAPGDVTISTGSGTVVIDGVRGAVRVRTGSGDLRAKGQPQGDWDLDTSSGDITVQIPASTGFDLEAETSSGSIYLAEEHPLSLTGRINPRRLRGKVQGGGVRLALSTSSGDINIE